MIGAILAAVMGGQAFQPLPWTNLPTDSAAGSITSVPTGGWVECGPKGCENIGDAPTIVLAHPPCGTPEAAKEPGGLCAAWVVRRPSVQPPDEWPPYEVRSGNLIDPSAPRPACAPSASALVWCSAPTFTLDGQ